ncbi:MAG: polyhydroxyalkanoic acid system family protein [Bacteroidota bacterium]
MAHIDVTRPHALGLNGARHAAEEVAAELRGAFPFRTHWEGDTLVARGAGFDAQFLAGDDAVRVLVKLGLVLRPMRHRIRGEIEAYLDRYIPA